MPTPPKRPAWGTNSCIGATAATLYDVDEANARRTTLAFSLHRAAHAELNVSDALGRRVETMISAGLQELRWEAGTAKPGLYLMRLVENGPSAATRQVIIEQTCSAA